MRGIWAQKSRIEWLKQYKNVKALFHLVCNWFSLFQMIQLEIQRKSPAFLRNWDSPGKKKRRKRIPCRGGYLRKNRMMVVNLQFCNVLATGGQAGSFSYCMLGLFRFQIKLMPLNCFRMLQCKFVKHKSQIGLYFLMVSIQAVCKLGFFCSFWVNKTCKKPHIINSKIIRKYNLQTLQKYWYMCFVANVFFILTFYTFLFSKL